MPQNRAASLRTANIGLTIRSEVDKASRSRASLVIRHTKRLEEAQQNVARCGARRLTKLDPSTRETGARQPQADTT